MRFVVVASRFRLSYPDKTIEDLRDRYYSIVRKLTELAASSPDELADHPLFVYPYNKGTARETLGHLVAELPDMCVRVCVCVCVCVCDRPRGRSQDPSREAVSSNTRGGA